MLNQLLLQVSERGVCVCMCVLQVCVDVCMDMCVDVCVDFEGVVMLDSLQPAVLWETQEAPVRVDGSDV